MKLFVSYAHEDRDWARILVQFLEARGHEVWWDIEIHGGEDWRQRIEERLNACDKIIVVWSPNSVGSRWVREEAEIAVQIERLIPVTAKECVIPAGFRMFQSIDLTQWDGEGRRKEAVTLISSIEGNKLSDYKSGDLEFGVSFGRAAQKNLTTCLAGIVVIISFSIWGNNANLDERVFDLEIRIFTIFMLGVFAGLSFYYKNRTLAEWIALGSGLSVAVLAVMIDVTNTEPGMSISGPTLSLNLCVLGAFIGLFSAIDLKKYFIFSVSILMIYINVNLEYTEFEIFPITGNALNLAVVYFSVGLFRFRQSI